VQARPTALAGSRVQARNPLVAGTAVVGIRVVGTRAVRIRVAVKVPNRAQVVVRQGAVGTPATACPNSEEPSDPAGLAADSGPVAACRS
jgi:hypothetical protein